MIFENVISAIEEFSFLRYAASWDKSGLQIAAQPKQVHKLAVFLDATVENVNFALQHSADCMLSHHPICLHPRLPNRLDAYHEVLRLLMGANVPLYAAHTSLDVNMDGPSGWLGRELDLQGGTVIEPVGADNTRIGYGEVGNLPRPLPFDVLMDRLFVLANINGASICGPEPAFEISRIAYCGGSGGSLIGQAAKAGAQLFVSGDIRYHDALDAEIAVLDMGHHSIEEEMMKRFAALLAVRLPELEVMFVPSRSPFRIISRKIQETCA